MGEPEGEGPLSHGYCGVCGFLELKKLLDSKNKTIEEMKKKI
jgi:hypothetical protein